MIARIPVQVSSHFLSVIAAKIPGVLCREGMADDEPFEIVWRHDHPPLVSRLEAGVNRADRIA